MWYLEVNIQPNMYLFMKSSNIGIKWIIRSIKKPETNKNSSTSGDEELASKTPAENTETRWVGYKNKLLKCSRATKGARIWTTEGREIRWSEPDVLRHVLLQGRHWQISKYFREKAEKLSKKGMLRSGETDHILALFWHFISPCFGPCNVPWLVCFSNMVCLPDS